MSTFYNCHIHTFTNKAVPNGFLPFGLLRLLRTRLGSLLVQFVVGLILRVVKSGRLERTLALARTGNLASQERIFNNVRRFYPGGTRFVVLPMDMDYMQAGRVPQPYEEQLAELRALYERPEYRDVLIPFIAVDPRRRDLEQLVRRYVDEHGFRGIKIYPPLGYYPFDERLDAVWAFAEERQIPVMTHCSRGGVYTRSRITESMRHHPLTGAYIRGGPKDFTDAYSDPDNYRPVLAKHPNLRLCLGHYGGGSEWHDWLRKPWPLPEPQSWLGKISDLIRAYPNVYTDIAYTACDSAYYPLIKVLLETEVIGDRILYGSDYYMVQMDVSERAFSIGLRGYLGTDNFMRLASVNAESFLAPARVPA